MRASPICRSLRGIETPKSVALYAVSDVTGKVGRPGRPKWSQRLPWPPAQEIPYPARVRFFDKEGRGLWADVIIDPTHAAAEDRLQLPRIEIQRRRVWHAQRQRGRQRAKRRLWERVERLEAEVAAMKAAERKDP